MGFEAGCALGTEILFYSLPSRMCRFSGFQAALPISIGCLHPMMPENQLASSRDAVNPTDLVSRCRELHQSSNDAGNFANVIPRCRESG